MAPDFPCRLSKSVTPYPTVLLSAQRVDSNINVSNYLNLDKPHNLEYFQRELDLFLPGRIFDAHCYAWQWDRSDIFGDIHGDVVVHGKSFIQSSTKIHGRSPLAHTLIFDDSNGIWDYLVDEIVYFDTSDNAIGRVVNTPIFFRRHQVPVARLVSISVNRYS